MHMKTCVDDGNPNYTIWQQKNQGYDLHHLRKCSPWSLIRGGHIGGWRPYEDLIQSVSNFAEDFIYMNDNISFHWRALWCHEDRLPHPNVQVHQFHHDFAIFMVVASHYWPPRRAPHPYDPRSPNPYLPLGLWNILLPNMKCFSDKPSVYKSRDSIFFLANNNHFYHYYFWRTMGL